MQQMAWQYPPLRYFKIICETWKLGCLQNEFGHPSNGPLETVSLRIIRSCQVGISGGSWVDLVTDSRVFFMANQGQGLFKQC